MDSTPVTARLLGRYFMIDGDELERSYKHHLSDCAEWEQRDHASNWMLIEDNLGENLSIDETMLQEDLVTILSNKAGHCKQGSVISIVRGTKAEDVIEVLMKIPEEAQAGSQGGDNGPVQQHACNRLYGFPECNHCA